jgi:hypothetical protein
MLGLDSFGLDMPFSAGGDMVPDLSTTQTARSGTAYGGTASSGGQTYNIGYPFTKRSSVLGLPADNTALMISLAALGVALLLLKKKGRK